MLQNTDIEPQIVAVGKSFYLTPVHFGERMYLFQSPERHEEPLASREAVPSYSIDYQNDKKHQTQSIESLEEYIL